MQQTIVMLAQAGIQCCPNLATPISLDSRLRGNDGYGIRSLHGNMVSINLNKCPRPKESVMTYSVLFLCTGNSARSILAEALLNQRGAGRFRAFSAGSHPNGRVNPLALELLNQSKFPTEYLRSKSWDEFASAGAPELDFVFTVCDNAAGEVCPIWPGQPITAHWGIPDPAAVTGSDTAKRAAFLDAFTVLDKRIGLFVSLPIASLAKLSLTEKVREIGKA